MAKRLAVTIAGAVSLGSYEAGVLFEFLDAIRQHNADPAVSPTDRVEIDVLTGASAGGMTAIILAQKLLFSGDDFEGPYDNPLYNTWVKRISLEGLQQTSDDELALHSLFSSNLIEAISEEALMARYAGPLPPPKRHGAVGNRIRVGVAMTNLNGIGYGYDLCPSGRFVYLNYGDQRTRLVDAAIPACDTATFWEPLREAAVACGAFPIAFRAQDVLRSAKGEPDDYSASNLMPWDQDPAPFTYSDGGVLQNQPLGIAKNLVDMIDQHLNQEERFYLFVSPHAKDPAANDAFHEANADYLRLIRRLLDVVMGQSGFQDWITAQGVNKRVALLDERAEGLKRAIGGGAINVSALQTTATSLLGLFFPGGSHIPPGATLPESLDAAKQRIAKQYVVEMDALGGGSPEALAFRDAVLAFETAAGLGARDLMTIYGVTATASQLAGAGLQAFLGFFDQRFRDHDYDVGRSHAREVLANPVLAAPGSIGPIHYVGCDIRPIDTRLDGLQLNQVPAADLSMFKAGMKKRLNQMLHELMGRTAFIADPVADAVLGGVLDYVIYRS